jgi:PAS domain S-box-containing protein
MGGPGDLVRGLLRVPARIVGVVGARLTAELRDDALLVDEAQLRLVLDSTAEGIYGLDPSGRCILANRSCARMLGFSHPDELLGREMHALMHHTRADGRPYPLEECRAYQALRTGAEVHIADEVFWRRDGSRFPAEYWSWPLLHEGKLAGAVVTFLDISERRRADEERERLLVEQHRARARAEGLVSLTTALNAGLALPQVLRAALTGAAEVLGAVDGAVFLFDGERVRAAAELCDRGRLSVELKLSDWPRRRAAAESGRVLYFTRAGCEGLEAEWFDRYQAAGVLVAPLTLGPSRSLGLMVLHFSDAASPPAPEDLEFAAAVAAHCAVAIDRGRSYDEMRREAELRDRLMAILGHDLRQPLNTISITAALLRRKGGELSEASQRSLERIERSAERMNAMIRDLLDYTRARGTPEVPVSLEAADVGEICRRAVDELQAGAGEGAIRLEVEGDCRGRVDSERLTQVISNLVGNALQYGDRSEPVVVSVRGGDEEIRLTIANKGPAIAAEALPQLFEPFRRVGRDRSPDGLGLGLYIVSEIVRAHGGGIEVRSSEEEGTTFSVRLPKNAGERLRS